MEAEQAAFRDIPVPSTDKAAAFLPDVVEVCQLVGETQSLHWLWVAVGLATVAPCLDPKNTLELCPSVAVPGSLWTALLHPGSTNSPGLLKVFTKALEKVFQRRNMLELEEAKASFQREKSELEEHGGDSRGLKFVPPPKRKGLAGGGSLAAAGACAAQAQNRGAFVAVEPELDGILAWLAQESVVDSAVPGKLWDNITWDRPVMSNARNFEIKDPFFAFLAGGHLPELLKKLQHDTFGLRQRLTVAYVEPLFLNIEDIRAACQKLPRETEHRPESFLAGLLYPLLHASLCRAVPVADGACEGQRFRPKMEDGAAGLVGQKFNFRNQKQKACYLQDGLHEQAKYNGKLKTKYDRMLLGVKYMHSLITHYLCMKEAGVDMFSFALSLCVAVV